MKRAALLLGLLLAASVAAVPTLADQAPRAVRLELSGTLADLEVLERDGDSPVLALLVLEEPAETAETAEEDEADDDTRLTPPIPTLYRFDPVTRTLAPWPLVDGGHRLPPGSIDLLPGAAESEPRLWVAAPRFGSLDLVPLTSGDASRHDLPRRAQRRPWGLRLTSPSPTPPVAASPDGGAARPPCHATPPEVHGRRLRLLLLCPSEEPQEIWATLPAAERVSGSAFGYLGDEPALAVLTHDKIGPFVQQDLRVFRLTPSRNRMGSEAILKAHTDCPLWRPQDLSFTDVDGDGRRDVLLVCEKGIVDQELRVEVYGGTGKGFERKARVRQIEGEFDAWRMREDLTGDGLPDLVLLADGRAAVHPGTTGRSPVADTAARSLPLPVPAEGSAEETGTTVQIQASDDDVETRRWTFGPRLTGAADLDGDGRPEVMIHRPREGGDVLLILGW